MIAIPIIPKITPIIVVVIALNISLIFGKYKKSPTKLVGLFYYMREGLSFLSSVHIAVPPESLFF